MMKGFHFRVLTPGQQHAAIQIRAHEIYQEQEKRAVSEDWTRAADALRLAGNRNPKNEEVRPIAQANYEQRMASETPSKREAAKLDNWLRAERQLLNGDRDDYGYGLPTVPFAEYKFSELTSEQQHLAIKKDAARHSRWRAIHEQEADWFKAAEQVQKTIKKPTDDQIRPVAEALYAERSTEAQRSAAEVNDWLQSEQYLKKQNAAYLPVASVPQLQPKRTFQALAV